MVSSQGDTKSDSVVATGLQSMFANCIDCGNVIDFYGITLTA